MVIDDPDLVRIYGAFEAAAILPARLQTLKCYFKALDSFKNISFLDKFIQYPLGPSTLLGHGNLDPKEAFFDFLANISVEKSPSVAPAFFIRLLLVYFRIDVRIRLIKTSLFQF